MHRLIALAVAGLPFAFVQTAGAGEFVVKNATIIEMKAVFGQVQSRIVVPARADRGIGAFASRQSGQ